MAIYSKVFGILLVFTIFINGFYLSNNAEGTNVSGPISSNTTWTLANSPYIVTGDVTVEFGANLTIEAGVQVKFSRYRSLIVYGNLSAIGTNSNMINFTSSDPAANPGNWDDIWIRQTGKAVIDYANINKSMYGLRIESASGSSISNSSLTRNWNGFYITSSSNHNIADNTISNNSDDGIHIYSSSNINIVRNAIFGNAGNGVFSWSSSNLNISDNSFFNNGVFFIGGAVGHFNTHTLQNNMVNGKPLYYYKNCNGNSLDGVPAGQVILANCTGVDVSNLQLDYTDVGIELAFTSMTNLTGNNASNDHYGIYIYESSGINVTGNYALENYFHGIFLFKSATSNLTGNFVFLNGDEGMKLEDSSNSNVSGNTIMNNTGFGLEILDSVYINVTNNYFEYDGLLIEGSIVSHFNTHTITVDNTVNGKPLYYHKNCNGMVIDGVIMGELILANCDDVDVLNLQIGYSDVGIEVGVSSNINLTFNYLFENFFYGLYLTTATYNNIENNDVMDNLHGIRLVDFSDYNTISTNDVMSNVYGISLYVSDYNDINSNSVISNSWKGIYLDSSDNNNITGNDVSQNMDGIALAFSNHNRISGNNVTQNNRGIELYDSSYNIIQANEVLDNYHGIYVSYDSSFNNITGNNVSTNEYGIYFNDADNNNVTDNNVSLNRFGVFIWNSENILLINNAFTEDGVFIKGILVSHFNTHNVTLNNLVNGKPIYYYKDCSGIVIDGIQAGQVILANCFNVAVRNLMLNHTDVGIEVAFSNNIHLKTNDINSNRYGIYDYNSTNSNISLNQISQNYEYGIYLELSTYFDVRGNVINGNSQDLWNGAGIRLQYSDNNYIVGNEVDLNVERGIYLYMSQGNDIDLNNVTRNNDDGISLESSSGNNITNNEIAQNQLMGLDLYLSSGNKISNNTVRSNGWEGVSIMSSSGNTFLFNEIYLNWCGVDFWASSNSLVGNNTFYSNTYGLRFSYSNGVTIRNNTLMSNNYGIYLNSSSNNKIYHNSFLNNNNQADDDRDNNLWNDSYPSGGNYWSDYSPTCADDFDGPITPQTTGLPDAICDVQYDIDADSIDYYPLTDNPIPVPDILPPEVSNVLINGLAVQTYQFSSIPALTLTATLDDSNTGSSDISGANYTIGNKQWGTSQPMSLVNPPTSPTEDFEATLSGFTQPGVYDIYVYGWDSELNYNTTSTAYARLIILDDLAPEISNVMIDDAPSKSYPLSNLPATVRLNATLDDTNTGGSNIAGANYTSAPFDWASATSMNPIDGFWNDDIVEPVTITVSTPTTPGIYSYCVYGSDSESNENVTSTECAQLTVVDDLPPTITDVKVDGGASVTILPGTSVSLTAVVSDAQRGGADTGGANYTIGLQQWSTSVPMILQSPPNSPTETYSGSIDTTGWADGTYTIYVYGWDSLSNYNTTSAAYATIIINSDLTPPEITNPQPSPDSTVYEDTPTIGADYSDETGIDTNSVIIRVNGVDVTSDATITTTGVRYEPMGLEDGTYTVFVQVSDLDGNTASKSWSFTVDIKDIDVDWHLLDEFWWILLIIIAVIIFFIILFLILRRRKKKKEEEEEERALDEIAMKEDEAPKPKEEVPMETKTEAAEEEIAEVPPNAAPVCAKCGQVLEPEYILCPNCGTKR